MSKALTMLLVAIFVLSSLVMVGSVSAQSVSKPSVPEFTVTFYDYSYDVPASTSIDPYSGKPVNNPAQHIDNKTLQISIKNQTIQSTEYLYYNIRMKGHFQPDWSNISYIQANPHSEYTVLTYALGVNNVSGSFDSRLEEISSGDTVDFQVQAQVWRYKLSDNPNSQFGGGWLFVMKSASGWSETQTVTIGENQTLSPEPTSTPTSTPYSELQSTEQGLILGVAVTVGVLGAGLVLLYYFTKRK